MLLLPKTVFIGEHVNVIIICLRSVLHACYILYNFAIFIHGSQKSTQIKGSELCICVCSGACNRRLGLGFSLRRRRLGFGFMRVGQG